MKFWNKKWLKKLPQTILEDGIGVAVFKIISVSMAILYEIRYGIDTETRMVLLDVPVLGDNKVHGGDYGPAPYLPIRLLLSKIKKILPPNGTFIDYGCGKGRVLLIASEYGMKTVKGIDYSPDLCQIARQNIDNYVKRSGSKTAFQVIESDALDYSIAPEDNVIFLFNPFDEVIFTQIIKKIEASLSKNPRYMVIIYMDPKNGHLFEGRQFCKVTKKYNFWSYSFNVFLNEARDLA